MSNWKPWHGELDDNNSPVYGEFKICTTCAKSLPSFPKEDPEHLIYHGYCSKECASEDGYGNYTW